MKAQTFKIVGKPSLLAAILEDLEAIGYRNGYTKKGAVLISTYYQGDYKDKNSFKAIQYIFSDTLNTNRSFILPQDYNKAIDFAKDQLADELWREEFKFGDIVKSCMGHIGKITGETTNDYELTKKDGRRVYETKLTTKLATPKEIEEYNRKEYKVGDLIKDNYTAFLMKVDYIRDRDYYGKGKTDINPDRYIGFKNAIDPTPAEIEEFNRIDWKVGDIVEKIDGSQKGKVGIIKTVENKRISVVNKEGNVMGDVYYTEPNVPYFFKKATPQQIEEFNKPVFKAGDWVTVDEEVNYILPKGHVFQLGKWKEGDDSDLKDYLTYIGSNGEKSSFHPNSLVGQSIRHATPEEIKKANEPKDGDIVTSRTIGNKGKLSINGTTWIVYKNNGERLGSGDYGVMSNHWRKATKEEIEEFNKPIKPEYVEMTVGSKNAKIHVHKTYAWAKEYSNNMDISQLRDFYNKISQTYSLTGYQILVADPTTRIFRVGCSDQNNLVSLNEIKAVLDAAEKL